MREALIVESSLPLGEERAEPGSEKWAQWLRLYSISVVDRAREMPEKFRTVHEMLVTHRAWVLLKKQDGTAFRTIEEFSAHPKPWGWGTPYSDLKPILAVAMARSTVAVPGGVAPIDVAPAMALAEVPESRQGERTDKTSHPLGEKCRTGGKEQRLARIARDGSGDVKDLFRAGLISDRDAAALSPEGRTPEKAAAIREAEQSIHAALLDAGPLKTKSDKRAIKSTVAEIVRAKLGQKPPSDADKARKALAKLSADERAEVAYEAAGGALPTSFAPAPPPAAATDADVTKRPHYRAALAACLYLTAAEWRDLRAEVDRNKGNRK